MAWEVYQRDYFVKLTNEFGQFASGYSPNSHEEALAEAHRLAASIQPPTYQFRRQPPVQRSIDDFV